MNSNGDLHDIVLYDGLVTSLAVPFWIRPGFAIPLVQSRFDSNVTYVQRVDSRRRIVGFDLFRVQSRTLPLREPLNTSVGGPELFALIDPRGDPYVGSQNALAPIVRKWVKWIESPLIRMSFARFCENEPLATRSAVEALDAKSSELKSKDLAILWFVDAIVLAELLEALGHDDSESDYLNEETYKKAWAEVRLEKGRLSIELPASLLNRETNRKYNSKLAKAFAFARAVLGRDLDLKTRQELRSPPTGFARTDRTEVIVAEIRHYSRQEQRLAVLIRRVLEHPLMGNYLLEAYSDHTSFMQQSLSMLRHALRGQSTAHELEQKVAATLTELISRAYPRQRGRLLLALAQELNAFRLPAMVIRDKTLKSRSKEVEPVKRQILKLLDDLTTLE